MKNIRKIFSVVLFFLMTLNCVLVRADLTSVTDVVAGADAFGLTNALKITDNISSGDLSSVITRGEFYAFLAKTAGYPETQSTDTVFADYTPGTEGEGYAKTLCKVGVLSPDANGRLYPEASLDAVEASALLLKVLGYGPKAETLGGYPSGYMAVAVSLDLDDGVNISSAALTKGEAIKLIYNALHIDMMLQTPSLSANKPEYKVSPDTNLLGTVFGVELVEGVVNGVDISRVAGVNDIKPFHIEIDGLVLESRAVKEPYSYLGYDVMAYYTHSRYFGPKIVYMEKSNVNEEIAINTEDISVIGSGKVKAYDENAKKYKNYSYITSVPVIYNGVATKQAFSKEIFKDKLGQIRLLDNTGDGKADVIFADVYENYVVSHVDLNDLVMYNKYDTSKKLTIDLDTDEPYVLIFDSEGKSAGSSDIKSGCVVSVYHSAADAYQQYIELRISTKNVVGEIEEVGDKGNEITIEGNVYKVNELVKPFIESYLMPGTGVKLLLDYKGEIAGCESSEAGTMTFGYLLGGAEKDGLDNSIVFRIYTLEGKFEDFTASNNIRIDGVKYSKNDIEMLVNIYRASLAVNDIEDANGYLEGKVALAAYVAEDAPMGSMVRYTVNTNGEINAIDTVMHNSKKVAKREDEKTANNALFYTKSDSVTDYMRRSGTHQWSIGPKICMTNTAAIIVHPDAFGENRYREDSFIAGTVAQHLNHDSCYQVCAYYTDDINLYANVLSMSEDVSGSIIAESANIAIVDHVSKIIDPTNSEQEADCLNVMTNGSMVKLPVKSGFTVPGSKEIYNTDSDLRASELQKGDVIRYRLDSRGFVQTMSLYYSIPLDSYSNEIRGLVYRHYFSLRDGYVYKSYKDGYLVYFGDEKDISQVTADDCEFVILTGASPVFYNFEKSEDGIIRILPGSVSDIKSYYAAGNDYSHILLQGNYGTPNVIVNIDIE